MVRKDRVLWFISWLLIAQPFGPFVSVSLFYLAGNFPSFLLGNACLPLAFPRSAPRSLCGWSQSCSDALLPFWCLSLLCLHHVPTVEQRWWGHRGNLGCEMPGSPLWSPFTAGPEASISTDSKWLQQWWWLQLRKRMFPQHCLVQNELGRGNVGCFILMVTSSYSPVNSY